MLNIKRLKTYISDSGKSKVQICTEANIARTTFDALLKGSDVRISTLEGVATVLGVQMSEFFDAPTAGGGDSAGRDVNKGNAKVLHIEQLNADQLAEVARLMRDREGGEGDQGVTEQGAALRADANPSNNTLAQLRQEIAQLRQDNAALRQDNDRLLKENALQAELLQLYRKG